MKQVSLLVLLSLFLTRKVEEEPVLYLYCDYCAEKIPIMDKLRLYELCVGELRSLIVRMTGLPIGMCILISM